MIIFSYLFNHDNIINAQIKILIERVYDQYLQEWFRELNDMSKLSAYKSYKSQFYMEKYFECVTNESRRSKLTRLRCSSHNLEIETGRYNRIVRASRMCKCCNMNLVEDEFHFLLACPFYTDLRRKYFSAYFCRWPSKKKFVELMTASQKGIIKKIAAFIYEAMKKRNILVS